MSKIEEGLHCHACDSQKIKKWLAGFEHRYQEDGAHKGKETGPGQVGLH